MLDQKALPEIVFGSADTSIAKQISALLKLGRLKKIAAKLYTSNLHDSGEVILKRNLFEVLGKLFPGAIMSFRSAFEVWPSPNGVIYLSYTYTKKIELPGLVISLSEAPPALETDRILSAELHIASLERALLENLSQGRINKKGESKILPRELIEQKLSQILQIEGEQELNKIRDRARNIATELGLEKPFQFLNQIISALLATRPSKILLSPLALATALGEPYDSYRVDLFGKLFSYLQQSTLPYRVEVQESSEAYTNLSFFEAYFSNYIEGTEFELEEAQGIIFHNLLIPNRSGDTHDIKGTFSIINQPSTLSRTPQNFAEFQTLLQERHQILMSGRPDKSPGKFKTRANRAGNTSFVEPLLVRGTLKKALDPYFALNHPLAKAIYMMFVVSEVHPFEDGNGRIARIMMNAELVKANLRRILIPTIYREDYLLALRKLSRQQIPDVYVRMLDRAQAFSAWLQTQDFGTAVQQLHLSKAFDEPEAGSLNWPA
jgi:hypothetical protein